MEYQTGEWLTCPSLSNSTLFLWAWCISQEKPPHDDTLYPGVNGKGVPRRYPSPDTEFSGDLSDEETGA
jgi:hypothetical protein